MYIETDTTVNPHIIFNGNCEEAMIFYKESLDGELQMLSYESSPEKIPGIPSPQKRISGGSIFKIFTLRSSFFPFGL